MARSLKSKRRKQNKRELRKRYKPRYDAHLKAIVANFQEQTDEVMDDSNAVDVVGYKVETVEKPVKYPVAPDLTEEKEENIVENMESEDEKSDSDSKIKIPKVDIKKVVKFMSQRKLRTYKSKMKRTKKRIANLKPCQKKKRIAKW